MRTRVTLLRIERRDEFDGFLAVGDDVQAAIQMMLAERFAHQKCVGFAVFHQHDVIRNYFTHKNQCIR